MWNDNSDSLRDCEWSPLKKSFTATNVPLWVSVAEVDVFPEYRSHEVPGVSASVKKRLQHSCT